MADTKDKLNGGIVLMQRALEHYDEGEFEQAEKDRETANRFFDEFVEHLNTEEGQRDELYGESRNFGIIYKVFESNINDLVEDSKKHKVIREVINTIMNNNVLHEQFHIYDTIEHCAINENVSVSQYANTLTDIIPHFSKKEIKENNDKLIKVLRDNNLFERVYIPTDKENLYEAVECIILNKKNMNNIAQITEAKNTIEKYISENATVSELNENEKPYETFVNELNEAEQNLELNEDEKQLIDEYTNPTTDKYGLFEKVKKHTLKQIKKTIEESEDKEEWSEIYEDVAKNKNYTGETDKDLITIAKMKEITTTLA